MKKFLSGRVLINIVTFIDDAKYACNGPLRRNRKFCVKLRAYTRYGWNDSECSNWIAVGKAINCQYLETFIEC